MLVGTVDITQISFVNGIQLLFYKSSGVMWTLVFRYSKPTCILQ
jgi:hypothetical protein